MSKNKKRYTSIGGQALIEGIMMRGPYKTFMAVRNKENEIVTKELFFTPLKEKYPVLGWPIIRGTVNFIESMKIGYKTLFGSSKSSKSRHK